MRISDWSSDVCSSDLERIVLEHFVLKPGSRRRDLLGNAQRGPVLAMERLADDVLGLGIAERIRLADQQGQNSGQSLAPFNEFRDRVGQVVEVDRRLRRAEHSRIQVRSEEHTSELPSLMRISYAVFCLKKKRNNKQESAKA